MKNFATFTILGRIARITPLNNVTKVTIAANYRRKNKDGTWEDAPHFNEVAIFDASTRRYVEEHCGKGDLVHVEGRLRQNKFERDRQTVYTVDLLSQDFGKLSFARLKPRFRPGWHNGWITRDPALQQPQAERVHLPAQADTDRRASKLNGRKYQRKRNNQAR